MKYNILATMLAISLAYIPAVPTWLSLVIIFVWNFAIPTSFVMGETSSK